MDISTYYSRNEMEWREHWNLSGREKLEEQVQQIKGQMRQEREELIALERYLAELRGCGEHEE